MTRYPKGGKSQKWTVKELDSIPKEWKGDTVSDGGGLVGEIRYHGSISIHFRYKFRYENKLSWYYCGAYPSNHIANIREERDKARQSVKDGIDPRASKKAGQIEAAASVIAIIETEKQNRASELTINDLFNVWIKDGVSRLNNNQYLTQTYKKYIAEKIGHIELRNLSEHDLRALLRQVISTGKTPTAIKIHSDISQMLRWAEQRQPWRKLLSDGNPSNLIEIEKLTPRDYDPIRKRLLSETEITELNQIFKKMESNYDEAPNKRKTTQPIAKETQIAIWLCLSTLCRIGELLMTRWENVSFIDRTWFIPRLDTKGKISSLTVYLSDFSLRQFKLLYEITGHTFHAFPSRLKSEQHICVKSVSKQVGDRQTDFKSHTGRLKNRVSNNSLVLGNKEWTPHDLRRSGATQMQKLKISRDVINLCQNHKIGTKVDESYLLDDYSDEKREAWRVLGHWLDGIL